MRDMETSKEMSSVIIGKERSNKKVGGPNSNGLRLKQGLKHYQRLAKTASVEQTRKMRPVPIEILIRAQKKILDKSKLHWDMITTPRIRVQRQFTGTKFLGNQNRGKGMKE